MQNPIIPSYDTTEDAAYVYKLPHMNNGYESHVGSNDPQVQKTIMAGNIYGDGEIDIEPLDLDSSTQSTSGNPNLMTSVEELLSYTENIYIVNEDGDVFGLGLFPFPERNDRPHHPVAAPVTPTTSWDYAINTYESLFKWADHSADGTPRTVYYRFTDYVKSNENYISIAKV